MGIYNLILFLYPVQRYDSNGHSGHALRILEMVTSGVVALDEWLYGAVSAQTMQSWQAFINDITVCCFASSTGRV